jgi:glycosyltransferase involved in cell wall biosynthesis
VRPSKSGSNEPYLISLIKALRTVDYENEYVIFVTPQNIALFREVIKGSDRFVLKIVPRIGNYRLVRIFLDQLVIPLWSRSLGADILHYPGTVASAIKMSLPKTVVTVHYDVDEILSPSVNWMKRQYFKILMNRTKHAAKALIVPSATFASSFAMRWHIPDSLLHIVYHGVEKNDQNTMPAAENNSLFAKYGIRGGYILSVTSTLPHKNLTRLLEAYAMIRSQLCEPIQLVLVGNVNPQSVRSALESLATEKLPRPEDGIVLTGFLSHREVASMYRQASIEVTPSLTESSSMVVLEAIENGCPVVASDILIHHEILGDAGIFVDPFSPQMIAEACLHLLHQPSLRRELTERGRRRAGLFSWKDTASQTINVYRSVYRKKQDC